MSLFSKILSGNGSDKSPLNILKDAVDGVAKEALAAAETAKKNFETNTASYFDRSNEPNTPQGSPAAMDSASGDSWGNLMPDEENQYNFPGNYIQYFTAVFRESFPAYNVVQEPGKDARSPLFVFYQNGDKKLVVELKSERSSAQAIRRQCEAEGVPYLRFYYDHDGWWNTRSYVTRRVSAALA